MMSTPVMRASRSSQDVGRAPGALSFADADLEDGRALAAGASGGKGGRLLACLRRRVLLSYGFLAALALLALLLVGEAARAQLSPSGCAGEAVGREHLARSTVPHLRNAADDAATFHFSLIADLDSASRVEGAKMRFRSILKRGVLHRLDGGGFGVSWPEGGEQELFSGHNEAGRGMELSELVQYNGRLFAPDDRTGIVFEVGAAAGGGVGVVPRAIAMEGSGVTDKGMKVEWASVKDGLLVLGSFGKEYTAPDGHVLSRNNNWIATMDANGVVSHYDWSTRYERLRAATGTQAPGYLIHEAAAWSPARQRWVFLPRRASTQPYDDREDEHRGADLMILADEAFERVEVRHVGPRVVPTHGFSSFKFLPGSGDGVIVALKSMEDAAEDAQDTFIMVFDMDGNVLMEETPVPGRHKYEGIEFV